MLPIAIGTPEIAIIGGIIILLFGVKKLPEIGRGLAEGIHEFKKASKEVTQKDSPASDESKSNE